MQEKQKLCDMFQVNYVDIPVVHGQWCQPPPPQQPPLGHHPQAQRQEQQAGQVGRQMIYYLYKYTQRTP